MYTKTLTMKNIRSYKFLFCALLSIVILSIFSCKEDVENPQLPVKQLVLGAILPLDQEKGLLRENSLRLAIDEINLAGGVGDGYFINLIVMSSEGADRKVEATAAAKQIIIHNKNVVGFISCFSSSTLGIVEDVSIPDHYPCISGAATASTLSDISPWFHRLCPPDNFEAEVLANRATLYGITTVAIAVEDGDPFSEELAAAFLSVFGTGVLNVVNFESGDLDYLNKMNQLLSGNPEGLFVSMLNPSVYIWFFDKLPQVNTTFILNDGLYTNGFFQADIVQIIGEINGHPRNFGAFPSADTSSETYTFFKDELMKKYNQQVASYNPQFYDIGYIYAMAIEKALMETGTSDMIALREKVNEYIRIVSRGDVGDTEVSPNQGWLNIKAACQAGGVNYVGASGNCDIDTMGNTETAYSIFKVIKPGNDYQFEIIEVIP